MTTSEYGQFRQIFKINDIRMQPSDVILESGTDSFFYFAR